MLYVLQNSQSSSASTPPPIDLMDGEEIEWQVAEVSTNGHPETFNGRIIVTNYRLAYLDQNGNETVRAQTPCLVYYYTSSNYFKLAYR